MTAGTERYAWGLICEQERIEAVQRHATAAEAKGIEEYRQSYNAAFGRYSHGLHYIPLPDQPRTVAIWFGPTDGEYDGA